MGVGEVDMNHELPPAREVAEARFSFNRLFPDVTFTQNEDGVLVIEAPEGRPELRQQAWNRIFEARLAFQQRHNVLPDNQRIITRAEGEYLLQLPRESSRLTDEQFTERLMQATDRAYQLYGPYARRALDEAIAFRSMSTTRRDEAIGMVRDMVEGVPVNPEQLQRMLEVEQLNREEEAWAGRDERSWLGRGGIMMNTPMAQMGGMDIVAPPPTPEPPEPGTLDRLFGRTPGPTGPLGPAAPETLRTPSRTGRGSGVPGISVSGPQPSPEEVQYLIEHPEIWERFDEDYGAGAAAMYLGVEPEARTGR
jgi:hypothetical protein